MEERYSPKHAEGRTGRRKSRTEARNAAPPKEGETIRPAPRHLAMFAMGDGIHII